MNKTTVSRGIILIFVIALFLGWTTTGVIIYFRILFMVFLLLIGSFSWNLFALKGISIDRTSRSSRSIVGKVFDERFILKNHSKFPSMWIEIEDLSELPKKSGSRLITGIGGFQQRSYFSRTHMVKRGVFHLGPIQMTSGDIFGIFTIHRKLESRKKLIVLPQVIKMKNFPSPVGLDQGGRSINKMAMDMTPNAIGIRSYIPGDPMRRIHWPTTAKKQEFMVKLFDKDPQQDIWIIIDGQADNHYRKTIDDSSSMNNKATFYKRALNEIPFDSFEYAITISASLANYFLMKNISVGLHCSCITNVVLPGERGSRQYNKIMETLAMIKPDGIMQLSTSISRLDNYFNLGSGVFLITPIINQEVLLTVDELERRKLHPFIIQISDNEKPHTPEEIAIREKIKNREFPCYEILCGEELEKQLILKPDSLHNTLIQSRY